MFVKYFLLGQMFVWFTRLNIFKVETTVAAFWATFLNIWATFYSNIWSHSQSGGKFGEKRCLDRENWRTHLVGKFRHFPQKIYFFNALNSKERLSQKWDLKSLLSYFNGETE